jgi:hypothetical protein
VLRDKGLVNMVRIAWTEWIVEKRMIFREVEGRRGRVVT